MPPYVETPISLHDLLPLVQPWVRSLNALRTRAEERILVFLHTPGSTTHYYDRDLSVIRVRTAHHCRGPRVTWRLLGRVFRDLDQMHAINPLIITGLDNGDADREIVARVVALVEARLNHS